MRESARARVQLIFVEPTRGVIPGGETYEAYIERLD